MCFCNCVMAPHDVYPNASSHQLTSALGLLVTLLAAVALLFGYAWTSIIFILYTSFDRINSTVQQTISNLLYVSLLIYKIYKFSISLFFIFVTLSKKKLNILSNWLLFFTFFYNFLDYLYNLAFFLFYTILKKWPSTRRNTRT